MTLERGAAVVTGGTRGIDCRHVVAVGQRLGVVPDYVPHFGKRSASRPQPIEG
jgi:hypothetical protein